VAKSAEALILRRMNDPIKAYAFIHKQSPCLHAEVPAFVETFRTGVSPACAKPLRRRQGTQAWSSAQADRFIITEKNPVSRNF
jgi:hypothetical protein